MFCVDNAYNCDMMSDLTFVLSGQNGDLVGHVLSKEKKIGTPVL